MKMLLIGPAPPCGENHTYVKEPPYEGIMIGGLSFGETLHLTDERIFAALSMGMPVTLYTPGLPKSPRNRALAASLSGACRQMKSWGILFTDGQQKKLITAEGARTLRQEGRRPPAGSVLTPLAKEILEGMI